MGCVRGLVETKLRQFGPSVRVPWAFLPSAAWAPDGTPVSAQGATLDVAPELGATLDVAPEQGATLDGQPEPGAIPDVPAA